MVENRSRIAGLVASVSDYKSALSDLSMVFQGGDKVVAGLRSRWVRRVVYPALRAHGELAIMDADRLGHARRAYAILDGCEDAVLRKECQEWIVEVYGAAGSEAVAHL